MVSFKNSIYSRLWYLERLPPCCVCLHWPSPPILILPNNLPVKRPTRPSDTYNACGSMSVSWTVQKSGWFTECLAIAINTQNKSLFSRADHLRQFFSVVGVVRLRQLFLLVNSTFKIFPNDFLKIFLTFSALRPSPSNFHILSHSSFWSPCRDATISDAPSPSRQQFDLLKVPVSVLFSTFNYSHAMPYV